jgi:hypothetical protein
VKKALYTLFILYFVYLSIHIALVGYILLYAVTDQAIILLVPDSCWAMARNGNIISAFFTEKRVGSKTD